MLVDIVYRVENLSSESWREEKREKSEKKE